MKEKILIVEDYFIEANNLKLILEKAGHVVCGIARSVPIALKIIERDHPDFVMLDIYLQGTLTGIDLAKILREINIPFIYISANSNKDTLEAAKATHPYGFLVKPFRERDILVTLEIARHLHENGLESIKRKEKNKPKEHLQPPLDTQHENFYGILGKSKPLQEVLRHLQIVAPTNTSVLIQGESGTGKERIADCIHKLSDRSKKPFIKINCASLPTDLVESTLFGHEKGAFTGATERRVGKFEQADGGTIFLDEIGELPMDVQVKLLRTLQEKEIERVGNNGIIKVDVRIIAATNKILENEVAANRFRIDLYYRLNVFPLNLPPLRERKEDIPALVNYFMGICENKFNKPLPPLSSKSLETLMESDWPGNIRQLQHAVERGALLYDGNGNFQIPSDDMDPRTQKIEGRIKSIEENERDHILAVLELCNGKVFGHGGAAEKLGTNASSLNYKIKKMGIVYNK